MAGDRAGEVTTKEGCILDTVHWYQRRDDGVYEGYSVECVAKDHQGHEFGSCPGERDLFEAKQ